MKHNKNVKRWFQRPEFLWRLQTAWCEERLQYDIAEDDIEGKMTMRINAISKEDDILSVGIQNIFLEENEKGDGLCHDVHSEIKAENRKWNIIPKRFT